MEQSVSEYPGQAILRNRVTESHGDKPLLLTKNESNFIFIVKTQVENDGRVWRCSQHSTAYHPSLDMQRGRVFVFTSAV